MWTSYDYMLPSPTTYTDDAKPKLEPLGMYVPNTVVCHLTTTVQFFDPQLRSETCFTKLCRGVFFAGVFMKRKLCYM